MIVYLFNKQTLFHVYLIKKYYIVLTIYFIMKYIFFLTKNKNKNKIEKKELLRYLLLPKKKIKKKEQKKRKPKFTLNYHLPVRFLINKAHHFFKKDLCNTLI